MLSESITKTAHNLIRKDIFYGDIVIDATLGTGEDTVFLAELVGNRGKVHAFDIQGKAWEISEKKLLAVGLADRVDFHLVNHEKVNDVIKTPVKAIMYNLGYMPGEESGIKTKGSSSLNSIRIGLSLLQPGGIMTICIYRGHEGGQDEADLIKKYLSTLPAKKYYLYELVQVNKSDKAPTLIYIRKRNQ
jgi:predicted methyltransferase